MKISIAKLALGLTLVSLSSIAMAANVPKNGIADTKHNMGGSNNDGRQSNTKTWGYNFTKATTEICVFCHTPHGADSAAAAPLWNRTLGSPAQYNTYASLGTSTMDALDRPVGGVSLACLSCHDGTQAMNTVINSPGSGTTGDVNVSGFDSNDNPIYIITGQSFTEPKLCAETGITDSNADCGGLREFQMMSQVAGEMIYLSTDLRNDHPVSIQYAGAAGAGNTLDANDDFHAASTATGGGGNTTVWYVESRDSSGGIISAGKTKADLPLYSEGLSGTLQLVECATCHDPHSTNTTFLRNPAGNEASVTCLSCHDK